VCCWLSVEGGGGTLHTVVSLLETPPAGWYTSCAPPRSSSTHLFSCLDYSSVIHTDVCFLCLPLFCIACACWFVCVCSFLLLFRRIHPSSHSALHAFQKFTGLMQKWHMVLLDFTIILIDESKHTSYFLRIKRTVNRRNSVQNLPLCSKIKYFFFLINLFEDGVSRTQILESKFKKPI
jgi:hypothetical protein